MAAFKLTLQTAVHGYRVYKTFVHPQSVKNLQKSNYNRHAVAVHGGEGVLGHLPCEILNVALFLKNDVSLTDNGGSSVEKTRN